MPRVTYFFRFACPHGEGGIALTWPGYDLVMKVQCATCGADLEVGPPKDEAPRVGRGAPGVESTGCSPPAPTSTREDTLPERVATSRPCTVCDYTGRAYCGKHKMQV